MKLLLMVLLMGSLLGCQTVLHELQVATSSEPICEESDSACKMDAAWRACKEKTEDVYNIEVTGEGTLKTKGKIALVDYNYQGTPMLLKNAGFEVVNAKDDPKYYVVSSMVSSLFSTYRELEISFRYKSIPDRPVIPQPKIFVSKTGVGAPTYGIAAKTTSVVPEDGYFYKILHVQIIDRKKMLKTGEVEVVWDGVAKSRGPSCNVDLAEVPLVYSLQKYIGTDTKGPKLEKVKVDDPNLNPYRIQTR